MRSTIILLLTGPIATPALAHRPLGGVPLETLTQGILPGIGQSEARLTGCPWGVDR